MPRMRAAYPQLLCQCVEIAQGSAERVATPVQNPTLPGRKCDTIGDRPTLGLRLRENLP